MIHLTHATPVFLATQPTDFRKGLDALITRVSDASEHGLALSPEDTQLLLNALLMLANVQSQLTDKNITLTKLRKLVGMVQSSERLNHVLDTAAGPSKPKRSTRKKTTVPPVKPRVEHHPHDTLSKGEDCPARQHLSERLRCNACYLDDTTYRILKQQPIEKTRPNSNKLHTRTGVYSSGLIAQCRDGRELI